jgi:hypothetical protein
MRLGIVSPSFRAGDYSPLMPGRHLKGGEEGGYVRDNFCVHLTFRSLTVLSPVMVAITLVDDAGEEVTFRFTGDDSGGIWCANGEEAFDDRYRLVPGPALPLWPERLALAALKAVREPLPDAEALSRLQEQVREDLERRWRSTGSE